MTPCRLDHSLPGARENSFDVWPSHVHIVGAGFRLSTQRNKRPLENLFGNFSDKCFCVFISIVFLTESILD